MESDTRPRDDEILETLTIQPSSAYIKEHMRGVKWIALTFIVALTVSIPGLVMISVSSPQTVTLKREENMNNTACVFVKRFHLTEKVYVTVCNLNGEMVLDIRKFVNNTATIKGLRLNLNQWGTLKQTMHSIDVAVNEARTYWKHLKGF